MKPIQRFPAVGRRAAARAERSLPLDVRSAQMWAGAAAVLGCLISLSSCAPALHGMRPSDAAAAADAGRPHELAVAGAGGLREPLGRIVARIALAGSKLFAASDAAVPDQSQVGREDQPIPPRAYSLREWKFRLWDRLSQRSPAASNRAGLLADAGPASAGQQPALKPGGDTAAPRRSENRGRPR